MQLSTFGQVIGVILIVSAFFGLIVYRGWQDRRELRRAAGADEAPAPSRPLRKTA